MQKITAKNFYYISIIYTVIMLPLGFWLAEKIIIFVSLLILLPAIWFTKFYQKPPINPNLMNLFWLIPFVVSVLFLLNGLDIKDNFVENKSQLQQITGTIPEKSTYIKSSRYYSTTFLELGDKRFHCENNVHDACHNIYQYKGQKAIVWYQPNTANGNLAYEIEVNGQKIYQFEKQKAVFLEQKSVATRQWFWTFILLVLPTIWLGWQDRKIRKSLPKMTPEQVAEFQKQLNENTESVGCLGLIGMMFFLVVSITSGTFAMILYIAKDIPSSVLLGFVTILTAFFTYLCVKPTKKKSPSK